MDIHTREKSALHTTPSPLRFLSSSRSSAVGAALIKVFLRVSKKEGSASAFALSGFGAFVPSMPASKPLFMSSKKPRVGLGAR